MREGNGGDQASAPLKEPIRLGPNGAKRVCLAFGAGCTTTDICDAVERLELPLAPEDGYCMQYALTELLANAVRASNEVHASAPATLDLWCEKGRLRAKVSDQAGGFDPSDLPYGLNTPVDEIDLEGEAFDAYRRRHGNRRFGIGLVMVRRAMRDFRLIFVGEDGREVAWGAGRAVKGTVVTFSTKIEENAHGSAV